MRLTHLISALTFAAAIASAACSDSMTAPSIGTATGFAALAAGTYASVASAGSIASNQPVCTGFTWHVTSVSATSVSGTFAATCYGTLPVTGSATATLSGTDVNWTATATGSAPGNTSCAISLTGSVEITGSQIRVPYTGTTCLGPVSGAEIMRR